MLATCSRVDDLVSDRSRVGSCPMAEGRASVYEVGVGDTDALLAARLAAGDDRALAEVFDRLAPAVYSGALRVLGHDAAAQEFAACRPRHRRWWLRVGHELFPVITSRHGRHTD